MAPTRPTYLTVHRWAHQGMMGVVLRTQLFGTRRFTRQEWLDQFFADVRAALERKARPIRAKRPAPTRPPGDAIAECKKKGLMR